MKKTSYNKLVRDKIPSIIEQQGRQVKTRVASADELSHFLTLKLMEECKEYSENSNVEELSDILEVIYALLTIHKTTFDELEVLRLEKRVKRGGFDNNIILLEVSGD